jgi:uncharacterized protein with HEPN domain
VPSKHDPAASFADILENLERTQDYVAGLDRETFGGDTLRRDALERCLERICEAAFRLGEKAAELAPSQPWADIRGLGNRLRHAYDRIDLDIFIPAIEAGRGVALVSASFIHSAGKRVKLLRLTPEPKPEIFGIAAPLGPLSTAAEKFRQCARQAALAIS